MLRHLGRKETRRKAKIVCPGDPGARNKRAKSESIKFKIIKARHSETWQGNGDKARHNEHEARQVREHPLLGSPMRGQVRPW